MSSEFGFEIQLPEGHQEAIEKVSQALQAEGFGVLTSIDVSSTLKEKIGAAFRSYTILGACNPQIAHQALSADPAIGLMLPCNVTVEESQGGSLVRIVNPQAMMAGFTQDSTGPMAALANDAEQRLRRVRDALA